jgi:hypothetical protein
MSMKFNHVANRLDPRYFETVVEMLKVTLRANNDETQTRREFRP